MILSDRMPMVYEGMEWLPARAISVRAYNCLAIMRVHSMDDFLALKRADFLAIKNCGKVTAAELAAFQDGMRAEQARQKSEAPR